MFLFPFPFLSLSRVVPAPVHLLLVSQARLPLLRASLVHLFLRASRVHLFLRASLVHPFLRANLAHPLPLPANLERLPQPLASQARLLRLLVSPALLPQLPVSQVLPLQPQASQVHQLRPRVNRATLLQPRANLARPPRPPVSLVHLFLRTLRLFLRLLFRAVAQSGPPVCRAPLPSPSQVLQANFRLVERLVLSLRPSPSSVSKWRTCGHWHACPVSIAAETAKVNLFCEQNVY